MNRRGFWGWVILGAVPLAACGGNAVPETSEAAMPPALVPVETTTVELPLVLPGQLYVEHDALLYARSEGVVEWIRADLGTQVRSGDTLARLESIDQEIALATAQADLSTSTRTVERFRQLTATGVVTPADSEQAELDFRRAELRVRQARRNLDLTRVIAPFAGVVTQRQIRRGRLVATGDPAFRVTALSPLLVSVQLPERAPVPTRGDHGQVVTLDGEVAAATVIRFSPTVDAASGTREVVLQLAPGSGLQPGMGVDVRLAPEARRVVAIPLDALADQGHVLVWDGARTLLRPVALGDTLPDRRIEVVRGLAPGDRVVKP